MLNAAGTGFLSLAEQNPSAALGQGYNYNEVFNYSRLTLNHGDDIWLGGIHTQSEKHAVANQAPIFIYIFLFDSRKSKSPPKVPIVIQDDSLTAGPPPQIRILKRPTTNGVLSNPHSASRPAFPVKSLAQREAEYAEARKRILGSASPEEEQEKPILDR